MESTISFNYKYASALINNFRNTYYIRVGRYLILIGLLVLISCSEGKEHVAPAINDKDSVSVMSSYGVNTLISDSGVIKYKIVAESWEVNQIKQPSRWIFINGIFIEQFDNSFNLKAYIQADTAWYYDQIKLWELRGRVKLRNVDGLRFNSEELFWDGIRHELYSNKLSVLVTPDRVLTGTCFKSDEQMNYYTISNSTGNFVKSDMDKQNENHNHSHKPISNHKSEAKSIPLKVQKANDVGVKK